MSKTKIGVFSVLAFGVMMLLIPATSIASAAEYDKYYKEKNDRYGKDYGYGYDNNNNDRYYDDYRPVDDRKSYDTYEEPYKKVDNKKESDRPVIIVKNKIPIPHQEKEKKKESPMVLVNKEVLLCDVIANGTDDFCEGPEEFAGPDSGRYVEECSSPLCEDINAELFDIKLVKEIGFKGSEDGTKLNVDEEGYTIVEDDSTTFPFFKFDCLQSGFDSGVIEEFDNGDEVGSCIIYEGECSGVVQDGELKECTVKNYIIGVQEQ